MVQYITKHGFAADSVKFTLQKCIRSTNEVIAMRIAYQLYATSPFHKEEIQNRLLAISEENIGSGNTDTPPFIRTKFELRGEFPYSDDDSPIYLGSKTGSFRKSRIMT